MLDFVLLTYSGDYCYPFISGCRLITTGGKWQGEGHCMGWYGSEYFIDVTVVGTLTEGAPGVVLYEKPLLIHKLPITSIYQSETHTVPSLQALLTKIGHTSFITTAVDEAELERWNKK